MESTESKRLTPAEQARTQIRNIIRSLGLIVSEHSACGLQELEDVLVDHFAPVFERAQAADAAQKIINREHNNRIDEALGWRERAERAEAACNAAEADALQYAMEKQAVEADVARLREALSSVVAGWPTMQALAIARRTLDALAATEPKRDE